MAPRWYTLTQLHRPTKGTIAPKIPTSESLKESQGLISSAILKKSTYRFQVLQHLTYLKYHKITPNSINKTH